MKIFKAPPQDFDTLLYIQFSLLILISVFMMFFSNGQSTIAYINAFVPDTMQKQIIDIHNITIGNFTSLYSVNYSLAEQNSQNIGKLMKYRADLTKQNFRIPYINLFIYWILMPLINYIYLIWFFFFRKKDLNSIL